MLEKKEFSVKLIETQQLEGMNMICSNVKHGCYEIRDGTVYYYQSAMNIMKIVEQLLAHDELLNECSKENIFKIRATAT